MWIKFTITLLIILSIAIIIVLKFAGDDTFTTGYCLFILGLFTYYCRSLFKLISLFNLKTFPTNNENAGETLSIQSKTHSKLNDLYESYLETCHVNYNNKTRIHADDFFSHSNVAGALNVNLKTIRSAPGILSGLGVLGTFFGLTIAISQFNTGNSQVIKESIDYLLEGMGTAFITSITGMAVSILFMAFEKKILNDLYHTITKWCRQLDNEHYISDVEILQESTIIQQKMLMDKLNDIHISQEKRNEFYQQELEGMKNKLQEICSSSQESCEIYKNGFAELKQLEADQHDELKNMFIGYSDEGEEVIPGSILIRLYEESSKQSQALESFTTDLSNELNSSLGKTMNQSIVPIIQDLEKTHQTFNEKLDVLATNIQSPATDMISSVVGELKTSMAQVTQEFKDNISKDTVNQMNTIASHLTQATQVLDNLPSTMQAISDNVTLSFGNVKDIISQLQTSIQNQQQLLLEGTQTVNQEMNQSLKTQFNEMVTILSRSVNAMNLGVNTNLNNAKDIIGQLQNDVQEQQKMLIQSTQEANEAMVNGMKKQFEEMMVLLTSSVTSLNLQQNDLIEGQGKSSKEIERLLFAFDESIRKMKVSNQEISRTLVSLQGIGDHMNQSAEQLNLMSNQMAQTNNDLQSQHKENIQHFYKVQEVNQETLDSITEALNNSKSILEKYTEQYNLIDKGLENIFKQIDEGLRGYSSTLKESTKDALAEYSDALKDSTDGLKGIAETLNETAEELTDSIEKFKRK